MLRAVRHTGLILALSLIAAQASFAQSPSRQVAEHLRYLDLLAKAEAQLAAGRPKIALARLKDALECDVRDSYVAQIGLESRGAVAHYFSACAQAQQDNHAAALDSLQAARDNGFRNVELLKTDARLNNVRHKPEFARIVESFPAGPLTDRFAGKTVADRDFGMSLLRHRRGNFPKLGETAPDFELGLIGKDDGGTLRLSAFRDKTPVVLIMGSFT